MKKYIITSAIGLAFAALIVFSKNVLSQTDSKAVFHILCDGFFVPGVCITCYGLLVFSSNEGTFDMLIYGTKKFASLFKKDASKEKYKTFYEYKAVQHEKRTSFAYLLIVGLAFIAISMVFLIFYYNV